MQDAVRPPLVAWQSSYVIMGSSAAALTGLQFVVVALIGEAGERRTADGIGAFATPTIVHFSAVLLLSTILSAPWQMLLSTALALGACGVAGVIYVVLVVMRLRRMTDYQPMLEDWLCHAVLPFIAYASLLSAAITLTRNSGMALFMVRGAALLLLFIGIHNAWDVATYITVESVQTRHAPTDND